MRDLVHVTPNVANVVDVYRDGDTCYVVAHTETPRGPVRTVSLMSAGTYFGLREDAKEKLGMPLYCAIARRLNIDDEPKNMELPPGEVLRMLGDGGSE
jgi:hypothetical protein